MQKNKDEIIAYINKILLRAICIIGGVFILTTFFGLIKKCSSSPKPVPVQIEENPDIKPFAGIGVVRALTKPDENAAKGSSLIISPWFNYPKDDTQFFEELSKLAPEFKAMTSSYFSQNTKKYFEKRGEEKIKSDLLELYNSKLVLGKLEKIYFDDYIFLN